MRKQYHWSVKLLAMVLVLVSAVGLALSGASVILNLNMGFYEPDASLEERLQAEVEEDLNWLTYESSEAIAAQYLMNSYTTANSVEREIWQQCFNQWCDTNDSKEYSYNIYSSSGAALASGSVTAADGAPVEYVDTYTHTLSMNMGTIVDLGSNQRGFPSYDVWTAEYREDYDWVDYSGSPLPDVDQRAHWYDLWDVDHHIYRVEYFDDIDLRVEILLTQEDIDEVVADGSTYPFQTAYRFRGFDIGAAVVSAIVLIAGTIYLCFGAGKKPYTMEIHPRFTNCIPLDLYAVAAGFCMILPAALGFRFLRSTEDAASLFYFRLYLAVYGLCAMAMALMAVTFLMALCAQVRLGKGQWLRRTVIGRCWNRFWGWIKRLVGKVTGPISDADLGAKAKGFLPKVVHWVRGTYKTMPLMWQWLILYGGLFIVTLWVAITFRYHEGWAFLLVAVAGFLIVLYTGYGFGKLRDAAKRMSEGDLDTKIDTFNEFLYGNFAEFAGDLNHLGDTCIDAAHEKMKSERMKSELITNVSHDIKTPLTSIINYVGLLQMAETEEQRKEYLEVLERQSQRLKKLIEDLMEMSKASSGNISAELTENDIIEAINQALGEFSDRMGNLNLNVVFRQRDESLTAVFDGKLLWRVMSNVLSNVVKYALPGTRVYVDVAADGTKVFLSIKNISREPLNITADELMERFVRGDASRNSEGNGLGLNIAKGLMEVQGGGLELTVDGDLFKITLTLNRN